MLTKYLTLFPLVVVASAAALSSNDDSPMKYQDDYEDSHANDSSYRSNMVKRDGDYVSLPLFNQGNNYAMELFMGSKGKKLSVYVTMSSALLSVNDNRISCLEYTKRELQSKRNISEHKDRPDEAKQLVNATTSLRHMSNRHQPKCKVWARGFFNWTESNTLKLHPSQNDTFPAEGLWVNGHSISVISKGSWISDKVRTSKTNINMIFAMVDLSGAKNGFLGIGRLDTTKRQMDGKYANFPEALKNAGYIQKMTYSLFLNKDDTKGGSIIFGGVDHKKYVGKLQTVPMLNIFDEKSEGIAIIVNKMYLENSSQKVVLLNEPIPAVLEITGGEPSFPKNVFFALVQLLSGSNSLQGNFYQVDCEYRNSKSNLVYGFSGITIKIPLKELVGEKDGICYLEAIPNDCHIHSSVWLSNSFLRYAYINVDLEKEEVSMAQAKFSDQEEIEKITTTVPRAVKAKQYSSTSIVTAVETPKVDTFEI